MANANIFKVLIFSFILSASDAVVRTTSIFKTIKTKHGDIYDCVDINKQPSLQHPALRGHKVQISPPQEIKQAIEGLLVREKHQPDRATASRARVGLKQGCPFGSVPIRRLAGRNSTMTSETYIQPLDETSRGGAQFAGLLINGNKVYRGAQSYLSLYNPKVGSDQSSSSIIALISKDGNTFNRIEAGWTVNPSEYGDAQTRLYISWTRDGYRSTGCFDTKCPGFVLTSRTTPLGYVFPKVSKRLHYEIYENFIIIQSVEQKAWWLNLGGRNVGYWPNEILTTIASGAQMVKFGGEVFQRDPSQNSPEMGSGMYRDGLYFSTAVDQRVTLLNSDKIVIQPDPSFTSVKKCECYFAGANYDRGGSFAYAFLYGGGGGPDCKRCDP